MPTATRTKTGLTTPATKGGSSPVRKAPGTAPVKRANDRPDLKLVQALRLRGPWDRVPVEYRECMFTFRHLFNPTKASTVGGFDLIWALCERCACHRLSEIDRHAGEIKYVYHHAPGYKEARPETITQDDRINYRLAMSQRLQTTLPPIDPKEMELMFGGHWSVR